MAPADAYPSRVAQDTDSDGVVYWQARWYAANYTTAFVMRVGQDLLNIVSNGVTHIDHIVVTQTTALANERTQLLIQGRIEYLDCLESADTTDTFHTYGPFGPKSGQQRVDGLFLTLLDGYSEWSGNCTATVQAYGRTRPRQNATDSVPIAAMPVDVKKIEVWPWKR